MRKYILVSMLLVPVLPFALSLGIGYYYFTSSLEHSTLSGLERVVEDHRQMIEYFLSERRADLELVLNSYTYEEIMQPARLQDILKHLQNKSNAFTDLGIFNAQGVHLAYCGPYKLTGKVYKQEYWFMEVMKNGYYISDVFLGFRRLPHFIIAVSRQDENQRWVLRAAIDTYFFNNLVEKVRIGKTGEAYILSSEKAFQTNRRSGGELMETDPDQANYSTSYTGVKTFINSDLGKGKYLYATTWLKNKNWLEGRPAVNHNSFFSGGDEDYSGVPVQLTAPYRGCLSQRGGYFDKLYLIAWSVVGRESKIYKVPLWPL